MNVLLSLLPHNLPAFVRQQILAQLFEATADAFGCPMPALDHLSFDERLQAYARFTREQAESALQGGQDIEALKVELYQNAYALGHRVRKWFGLETMEEVMKLGQILYRVIEIDMEGDAQGQVTVRRCFFSQVYSALVCDLISALDDGLFAGLSGGCRLTFLERMTEGCDCCRARLEPGDC